MEDDNKKYLSKDIFVTDELIVDKKIAIRIIEMKLKKKDAQEETSHVV